MIELDEGAFYMVPEKAGSKVVRLRAAEANHVVLEGVEEYGRWTVRREPFEVRLREGRIQKVRPQWFPAADEVPADG